MEDRLSRAATSGPLAPSGGDTEEVARKLEDVRFADYYRILELDPDGPLADGAVALAHARLCRRFDLGRYVDRASPELESALNEIRDGLDDARDVLTEPVTRERYRRGIR